MSSSAEGLAVELVNVKAEIKRLQDRLKELRARKVNRENRLFAYMTKHDLEEVGDVSLRSVTPKVSFRKKEAEKREDGIRYLTELGVENPEEEYRNFFAAIKAKPGQAEGGDDNEE